MGHYTADFFRAQGWVVAVHNDYVQNGELFTFWLFTKGSRCAKGEGRNDTEALTQVAEAIQRIEEECLPSKT